MVVRVGCLDEGTEVGETVVGVTVGANEGKEVGETVVGVFEGNDEGANVGEKVVEKVRVVGAVVGAHDPQLHIVTPATYVASVHAQSLKASVPMDVTDWGITIEDRAVHPLKALSPMDVTEVPMTTELRRSHCLNATTPMAVTESPMSTVNRTGH